MRDLNKNDYYSIYFISLNFRDAGSWAIYLFFVRTSSEKRTSSRMTKARPVARILKGQKLMEGAGVRICRTIGVNGIRVDPFLLLDELKLPAAQATAGFPDHPVSTVPCKFEMH